VERIAKGEIAANGIMSWIAYGDRISELMGM